VIHWIDANPWLSIAVFFGAGAVVGLIIRNHRRGKYEAREAALQARQGAA
jgi:hypothetical protein